MTDNSTYILTLELPGDDEPQRLYIGNSEGLKNYLIENSSDLFDWIMEEGYINPDDCNKFSIQTLKEYNDYLFELITPPFNPGRINIYLRFANTWDNFRIGLDWYEENSTTYTLTVTNPKTGGKKLLFEGNNEETWEYLTKNSESLFNEVYFFDYPNTDEERKEAYNRLFAYNKYLYQLMSNDHDPTKLTFPPSNITLEWS